MLKIMMMTSKIEGYKVAGYANTVEEILNKIDWLKEYYSPIDVHYTTI